MRIRILLFTLMRIRIQIWRPKIMRIRISIHIAGLSFIKLCWLKDESPLAPVEPLRDCPSILLVLLPSRCAPPVFHAKFCSLFETTSHSLPVLNLQGSYYSNPLSLAGRRSVSRPLALRPQVQRVSSTTSGPACLCHRFEPSFFAH